MRNQSHTSRYTPALPSTIIIHVANSACKPILPIIIYSLSQSFLQITVETYKEASLLYANAKAERCDCERDLQNALVGLERATLKVQKARKRLTQANFNVGRARHIARRSGFSDVFLPVQPVKRYQIGGMHPFFVKFETLFIVHTMQIPTSFQLP